MEERTKNSGIGKTTNEKGEANEAYPRQKQKNSEEKNSKTKRTHGQRKKQENMKENSIKMQRNQENTRKPINA